MKSLNQWRLNWWQRLHMTAGHIPSDHTENGQERVPLWVSQQSHTEDMPTTNAPWKHLQQQQQQQQENAETETEPLEINEEQEQCQMGRVLELRTETGMVSTPLANSAKKEKQRKAKEGEREREGTAKIDWSQIDWAALKKSSNKGSP